MFVCMLKYVNNTMLIIILFELFRVKLFIKNKKCELYKKEMLKIVIN